ncbi:MAG TPA: transcription elongation factor GreA [Solirubrobacteraceae bacterium]|nr:transcription elongation factor GreA [Solirubrobacteraceae bacterium]
MSAPVGGFGSITRAGYERLQAELDQLVEVERPLIAQWLRDARDDGGEPGENADVAGALEERASLEKRINDLRRRLATARIVEPVEDGTVGIGAYVRLRAGSRELDYQLVGAAEGDPTQHRLSIDSPVGQALAGHAAGDVVTVDAPSGRRTFEILAVSYARDALAA